MKSTKTNKGITLIALIITIVVLLILAVVAISSIQNDGILHYAQNAADSWNQAAQNEAEILDGYLGYLNPCGTKGHTWGEWIITVEADCSTKTNGVKAQKCTVCGATNQETQEVVYYQCADGILCPVCGGYCEHEDWEYYGDPWYEGDGTHSQEEICLHCGHTSMAFLNEPCEYNDEGVCIYCGFSRSTCEHEETTKIYSNLTATTHTEVCNSCGETIATVEHCWDNADGYCSDCNYSCQSHDEIWDTYAWHDIDGDQHGYYTDTCSVCGYSESSEYCTEWERSENCTICHPKLLEE